MDSKTPIADAMDDRNREDAVKYAYVVGHLSASKHGDDILESLDRIAGQFGGCQYAAQVAADIRESRERAEQRATERKARAA